MKLNASLGQIKVRQLSITITQSLELFTTVIKGKEKAANFKP